MSKWVYFILQNTVLNNDYSSALKGTYQVHFYKM